LLQVLGDIHGIERLPRRITRPTFQLGDLALDYEGLDLYDPNLLKFGQGNHDDHNILTKNPPPHFVGRFGSVVHGGVAFYWIGGAYSHDHAHRTMFHDIWPNEELAFTEATRVLKEVKELRPEMIISHEAPDTIRKRLHPEWEGSHTSRLLDEVLKVAPPKLWVAGHLHQSYRERVGNTLVIGLDINEILYVGEGYTPYR
jgi:hypothetical protein